MFFWGVGTSNLGTTSALGWSPALCATAMAVGGEWCSAVWCGITDDGLQYHGIKLSTDYVDIYIYIFEYNFVKDVQSDW